LYKFLLISALHQWSLKDDEMLTVDVSQAGEGQLEIMVNRGTVPNTARMVSKGLFNVSFIPRDARPHEVDIRFNGELLARK